MSRVLWSGIRTHVLLLTRSGFDLLGVTVWPILFATTAYYLFGAEANPERLFAASLGATVMAIWSSVTTGASGALEFQHWLGTLELLVAAPVPFIAVLAPITVATATIGVYALVATLVWGWAVFDVPVAMEQPLLFVVALPVSIVAIGALGMIMASVMILTRAGVFLGNSLEYPGWLATGLLVPLAVLPGWVTPISWVLAPRWGIDALRDASFGGNPLPELGMCLVLSLAYAAVAVVCLRNFERLARERATLALA